MKNLKLLPFLYILLSLSALIAFLFFYFGDYNKLNFEFIYKTFPKVVTIDTLLIGLFSKYLWNWKYFQNWLVPFPDLNGTWKGFIHTTWVDPITNERPDKIPTLLTINQNFFSISCVMRTGEMTSRSIISEFSIDEENQLKRLIYTYDSNPIATVRDRSPQHCGTIYLDVNNGKNILKGEYWTGRKTTGEVRLEFWKKEKLDYYPDELGEHPVSKNRE